MKHKPESWNGATSNAASSSVRRSLTRAGLQLGQLSHVVSGAFSNLQAGASPRGAAQNRMRALLNQDRALLSHRACGQASLEDEDDAMRDLAELPVKGSRSAAQNRMRELLNQDRALLALREARRRENPASEPLDDDFAAELVQLVDREWNPVPEAALAAADASVARGPCVGVTTSFPVEATVATVCTPGPVAPAAPSAIAAAPARSAQPAFTQVASAQQAVGFVQAAPVAQPAAAAPTVSVAQAPAAVQPAPFVPAQIVPVAAAAVAQPAAPAMPVGQAAHPAQSARVAPAGPALAGPKPMAAAPKPATSARAAASDSEDSGGDPIRTRGMAKLLALQGYRDRALSIYDELIAAEPDNAELRAEADRLRS